MNFTAANQMTFPEPDITTHMGSAIRGGINILGKARPGVVVCVGNTPTEAVFAAERMAVYQERNDLGFMYVPFSDKHHHLSTQPYPLIVDWPASKTTSLTHVFANVGLTGEVLSHGLQHGERLTLVDLLDTGHSMATFIGELHLATHQDIGAALLMDRIDILDVGNGYSYSYSHLRFKCNSALYRVPIYKVDNGLVGTRGLTDTERWLAKQSYRDYRRGFTPPRLTMTTQLRNELRAIDTELRDFYWRTDVPLSEVPEQGFFI